MIVTDAASASCGPDRRKTVSGELKTRDNGGGLAREQSFGTDVWVRADEAEQAKREDAGACHGACRTLVVQHVSRWLHETLGGLASS